ncbi:MULTISPECIES: KAP family P-loop NTPase fold protein [unclassified Myroides]|uniref:KAP family P-loop NTPase fold protein n=1 Tax=unclassified Myroides TaxID=2642485 RepID=UPI003101ACEA
MNTKKDKNEKGISILAYKDKKTIYSLLIVTIVLLSFEDSILRLYDKHIMTYLLDVEDNMLPFWLVLIGLLSFFIWKFEGWVKNKLFTPYRYLIAMGYVILLYAYYSWYKVIYIAYPSYCGFGLSDLLILALAVVFLLMLYLNFKALNITTEKESINHRLYSDGPIEYFEDDLFGLENKILDVIQGINNIDENIKGALRIGIVGKWGQGKSSFLNLLEEKISKDGDKVIVNFNPRHSKDIDNIQYDFFQTLYSKIEKYNGEFSVLFKDYLKAINVIDKTGIIEIFTVKNVFKSKEDEKITLNREIKKIGKKIVVIIDDLDRLQADEIIEIFKLIDYTASFSNIIFITAYDKEYINGVLESKYHQTDSYFSDKFFNQEIFLSPISKDTVFNFLSTELKKSLNSTTDVVEKVDALLQKHRKIINSVFYSLRDAKRFLNMFTQRYKFLSKYDVFENLFLLYILKSKWYDFYLFVYKKCLDIHLELLSNIFDKDKVEQEDYRKFMLEEYLKQKANNITIVHDREILKAILEGLNFIDESFLRQPALFEFYFQEEVNGNSFKYTYLYMDHFFNKKLDDIIEEINWYFDTKRIQELCSFVAHQDLYKITDKEQLNNYLDLLLYTNARSENEWGLYFRLLKFFDKKDGDINRVIEEITNVDLNSILLSKLKASSPYYPRVFIRNLVSKLFPSGDNGEVSISPIVTNDEVLKLTKEYLNKYIEDHPKFSKEHLNILYTCISSIEQNENRTITLDNEACQIILNLIKQSPEEYFKIALTYQVNEIYLEPFYKQIFGSNAMFEQFINSSIYDKYEIIELIRNYWTLYKANNYQSITLQGNAKLSLDRNLKDEVLILNQINLYIDEVRAIDVKTIANEERLAEIEEYMYRNNLYIARRYKLDTLIIKKKKELGIY